MHFICGIPLDFVLDPLERVKMIFYLNGLSRTFNIIELLRRQRSSKN